MTLGRKLLIIIGTVLGLGLALFQYLIYNDIKTQAETDLLNSAEHVRNVLMATRRVYQHQFLDSGLPLTDKTIGFLPAHAMNAISKDFANWDKSGLSFNNVSDRPRNRENQADALELKAMAYFRAHPKETRRVVPYKSANGEPYFHYTQPIWIEPYCLTCHGSKASAPATIRARYDTAYDYKVGELRGLLSIKIPANILYQRVHKAFIEQLAWGLTLILLMGTGIGWAIRRNVIKPISLLDTAIDRVTSGDITHRIASLPGEFNRIGGSFNKMAEAIDTKQRALSDSEQQFRMLAQTAADAIILTDREGRILHWNDGAEKVFGYSADEMINQSIDRLIPEQSREGHKRGLERVNRGKAPKYIGNVVELQALHRDGHEFPIEISLNSWANGENRFHVAIIRDISDRKQAETSLHDSEIKFHTMTDWTTDWEYWVKPDGHFHYMTPSVERVTGYRAVEFEQHPALINAIIHPEDRHLWEAHGRHYPAEAGSESVVQLDIRIIRKNGETRWLNHTCRPVYSEAGAYLGRRVSMRDITERKVAEDEIRHLAYFDSLTHLPNRRLLSDRLGQALIVSKRNGEYGALMILDLDHFKKLNDTQGHDLGDRLLVETARRLKMTVRQEDTVSRLGGDEFVVMMEGLGNEEPAAANQTEQIAEKIRSALYLPYALNEHETDYLSTVSIGMTLFSGQDTSIEVLMKQADVALYQAKDAGRNVVRFFNPAMQAIIDTRSALESALRRGMLMGEFKVYYQPQVDQHGKRIGAEALIRWLNPSRGLVSPAEFIPLAEETGLINELGQWVLDTACAQLAKWAHSPDTNALQIAVNVSARQFRQPDFVESVLKSLAIAGVDPTHLKLELTESIILKNVDLVITNMKALNALGVSFSMDDFGTGYSSLSYLKRLPLAQVKIDQSFVRDLVEDTNDAAIVRAIVAMSQSLGLHVIAEGVETSAQRDFLHKNGCLAYQGYLFGKPMPIEEWDASA